MLIILYLLCDVYVFFCSVSHSIDATDRPDVHAEICSQLSDPTREITEPIESAIKPDTSQVTTVICGHLPEEITEQNPMFPFEQSMPETTSNQDGNKVIEVKQDKADQSRIYTRCLRDISS